MANHDELEELLTLREVLRAEGCSRSTLYLRIGRGEFPPPLANETHRTANRWKKSEVLRHQRERFAKLDEIAKKRQTEQAAA